MPVINVRRVGALPGFSVASYHMIPTINPAANAAVQGAFSTMQQQAQQAAAACAQFTDAPSLAACQEAMQSPDTATLTPDQLAFLIHGKVQCHAFFDTHGIVASDQQIDQCILNPSAFITQAGGDAAAGKSFFAAHKTPLLIGGGLLAALVLWKVIA